MYLATSLAEKKAQEVVKLYGKRFTIEETFRLLRRICGCTRGTATAGLKRPSRGHAGLQRSGSSIPA